VVGEKTERDNMVYDNLKIDLENKQNVVEYRIS
jgi:hypothetical protein